MIYVNWVPSYMLVVMADHGDTVLTTTPDRGGQPGIAFPSFGRPVRSLVTISTELQCVTVRMMLVSMTDRTSLRYNTLRKVCGRCGC
jgi:hypothetical protein